MLINQRSFLRVVAIAFHLFAKSICHRLLEQMHQRPIRLGLSKRDDPEFNVLIFYPAFLGALQFLSGDDSVIVICTIGVDELTGWQIAFTEMIDTREGGLYAGRQNKHFEKQSSYGKTTQTLHVVTFVSIAVSLTSLTVPGLRYGGLVLTKFRARRTED
ncbi:MAG: hypothetical protein CMG91_14345 [Marinobacter sp.]|nr:hypothetical protein [Marinobacter sp.]